MNKMRSLAIFTIFFSFIFLLNFNPSYAWLSGFTYRKPINITNWNITANLTDYQVSITLNTASLISAGKMRSDCGDIRFALANDTLLSYWLEAGCNSATTKIWVKVPFIPGNITNIGYGNGSIIIYVYYGNPTATSLSNDTNVFIFSTFAERDQLNTWNVYDGDGTGTNNQIYYDSTNKRIVIKASSSGGASIYAKTTFPFGIGFVWEANATVLYDRAYPAPRFGLGISSSYPPSGTYPWGAGNEQAKFYQVSNVLDKVIYAVVVGGTEYNSGQQAFDQNNHIFKITSTPSGTYFYIDNNLKWSTTYYPNNNTLIPFHGMDGACISNVQYQYIYWVRVRKYTSPEPIYSIGAEEVNNPPTITIYLPTNSTYFYSNNFIFNFSVSDDRSTTFWIRAYLDNNLIYENTSYQNNSLVVLTQNLNQVKSYNFTVFANDTDANSPQTSSLTIIFSIKDFEISSIEYDQYPYETKDYNYSITFRYNPDLVSNITSKLNWNNQYLVDANYTFKNSTHIKNTATFTLPLIQQNNTQVSFRFVNVIYYTNNDFQTVESNVYNQNITFAYWIDSISSDRNDYIEFEDATIKLNVKDKVGRASLSATITFIYNSTYNVSRDILSYSTQSDLKVFNYTFDTLESFSDNETRSYFANLTVSFQGNSRVMNSPVQQLKVYKIILTNCSIYPTKALTFYVKDEETDNPIQNAIIEATFNVWKTGEIIRNYAWKFNLINTDNQSICIYPSWAEYSIDAMLQYYKDGYMDRTYYIYSKINNKTSGVNLYLLNINLGNIIIVYVTDENGNKVQGAIVKIQRYYVGSNSYKTVAQVKTDYEGKGVTFLRVNEIYYRFIIEKNFVVVRETEPTIITCTAGGCPPYPVTLSISEQTPAKYFRYIGKIAYACQMNEETNILKCTVDDTSQLMQKARLLVEQKGALKFDTLCDNICESSACTLTCDLGNRTNNIYRYILSAYIPEQIILEQNILDYKQALISWGAQGLLITFLLTSTLFFVGIWNPVTAMIFALLGIIAGYLLGFTPVSISSLIGLALAVGILIYKMRS